MKPGNILLLLALPSCLFALEEYKERVPSSPLGSEGVGHVGKGEGGPVNHFGIDFAGTRHPEPWLSECPRCGGRNLCQMDSDGDGWTNGEELGDPCCQWRLKGLELEALSHPGDSASVPRSASAARHSACPATLRQIVFPLPRDTIRRLMAVEAVIAATLLVLVVIAGLILRTARKTALGGTILYRQIVPAVSFKTPLPDWIKAVDVLGVLDIIPELTKFTLDRLLVFVVAFAGIASTFVIHMSSNSTRNSPLQTIIGLSVGNAAEWWFALAMLPITRNSVWAYTLGCSFERAIFAHRVFGRIAVLAAGAHGAISLNQGFGLFDEFGTKTLYGSISLLLAMILLLMTTGPMRRRAFELFYYLHVPLALTLLAVGALHAPHLGYKLILPAALWVADMLIRVYRGRFRSATIIKKEVLNDLGGAQVLHLEIRVSRGWEMEPGGYVFLNHPKTSAFTWHPFSPISSSGNGVREHDVFSLFIQSTKDMPESSYCKSVTRLAEVGDSVHVDGPYGRPSVPTGDYASLLVAGGIGITPMLSLAEKLHDLKVPFHLVWSVRSQAIIDALTPTMRSISSGGIISVYMTGAQVPSSQAQASSSYIPTSNHSPDVTDEEANGAFTLKQGRPDLQDLVEKTAKEMCGIGRRLGVYACGPVPLVQAAANTSRSKHAAFHSETFLF